MVARKDDAETPAGGQTDDLFPRVFTTWRALLGRLGRAVSDFAFPGHEVRQRRGARIASLAPFLVAAVCVAAGAATGVALASASGDARAAWMAAASTTVWAFGRLLVLELALPRRLARASVTRPWAWGLAPYSIAVTPLLTLVAWLLSAALTAWLFHREGLDRSEVIRGVAAAWGAQALFAGVAWLIVNGWVAVLATR